MSIHLSSLLPDPADFRIPFSRIIARERHLFNSAMDPGLLKRLNAAA